MMTAEPVDVANEEAFRLERHGIDHVPEGERWARPSSLFGMWSGAIVNFETLVYGAVLMSFGVTFPQAVVIIVVGNLSYLLLGLTSLQGPGAGTTTFVINRAAYGPNGGRLIALFNWLTQVGFEVEGLVLIVLVVEAMFSKGGITSGTGLKIVIILGAVLLQFIIPFLGHATITKVLRYLSFVFIVVFAVMAILVFPHVNLGDLAASRVKAKQPVSAGWQVITTAIVLLISAGGLGWTENGNDYSRYLPRSTPKAQTFWAATLGGAIPSILLEILGAAAYVVSPNAAAVTGVPSSFASWFFWPFLILALPQLFAINSLDMYSSGVTLQALGVPVKRWGAVIIDTIVAGGVTFLVVFKGSFYNDLSGFLDYIVVWLAPWFGILTVDWLLRRGRYDKAALVNEFGGVYWRSGGINWKAIIAMALGMAASLLWINAQFYQPSYLSPLSSATNGSDFSWLVGIVVGAAVYFALSFKSVPAEASLLE